MNSLSKKISIFVLFAVVCAGTKIFAQQITKFAVVDTSRVYRSYFRDTAPVRNYESKKAEFQNEINTRTEELKSLQSKKLDYQKNGDDKNVLKIEAEIAKKTDYLNEYISAKNIELESLSKSLQNNDAFYKKLQATLAKIAESGGYSMILSLQ